ncbi:MAG: lamin tail domain-containing protein [Thermoproteota archaeon]|nr:lamin tail domain-containing protein [Thermoproteota archaeon]
MIAAGGSVPSGFGQNTAPNIGIRDVVDLEANVTDREQGVAEVEDDDSNFLKVYDVGNNNDNSNHNSSSGGGGGSVSTSSSSLSLSPSSSPSSLTASQAILINEIELNPPGEYDEGKEWLELYNPTDVDINISNFEIGTTSESATIRLPPDAIIEAGKTYVIELKEQILSNNVDSIVLTNAAGDILDRTPSLVDRSDDDRTWQRIPDGNNEWQFVENTEGNPNGDDRSDDVPDTLGTILENAENTRDNPNVDNDNNNDHSEILSRILGSMYSASEPAKCQGSAGCFEGVVTRIVDGDTLYVRANSSVYKVELALTEAPSRGEGFSESTAFTRDLCLGSTVLVDQDDKLLTSADSNTIGVVYCSSSNLNKELLDNGYAGLNMQQCATSEFATESWAQDHGC